MRLLGDPVLRRTYAERARRRTEALFDMWRNGTHLAEHLRSVQRRPLPGHATLVAAALREVVASGPPPGLLAMDGNAAVGWCQLTPRDQLPALERNHRLQRVDDTPVWAISCFYIRKDHRRQGVTTALIKAAVETARRGGAVAVEAYPLDADLTPSTSHTGYVTTFERLGFREVARHVPPRPILRYDLSD